MESKEFVTKKDFAEIMAKIYEKKPFKFIKELKKIEIMWYSSTAKGDWDGKTRDGEYIIISNKFKKYGDYCCSGSPYTHNEFIEKFSCYDVFLGNLDNWLCREINKKKTISILENLTFGEQKIIFGEQISLF